MGVWGAAARAQSSPEGQVSMEYHIQAGKMQEIVPAPRPRYFALALANAPAAARRFPEGHTTCGTVSVNS
jgi:hypothetical protein